MLLLAASSSVARSADQQTPDTQSINNGFVRQVLQEIGDKRTQPAGKVFKNIQLENLAGVPADTLLGIMIGGYSKALGVTCAHCHDTTDFSSDAKRPKKAAREMALMHRQINQTLLKMQHLEAVGEDRFINCAVCHRGAVGPVR